MNSNIKNKQKKKPHRFQDCRGLVLQSFIYSFIHLREVMKETNTQSAFGIWDIFVVIISANCFFPPPTLINLFIMEPYFIHCFIGNICLVMNYPLQHDTIPPTQTVYQLKVQCIFKRLLENFGFLEAFQIVPKSGQNRRWVEVWIVIPTIPTMINVCHPIANNGLLNCDNEGVC